MPILKKNIYLPSSNTRIVFDVPEPEGYYNRVYDRLYAVVERYVIQSDDHNTKFTIFLNAVPRNEKFDMSKKGFLLNYQGLKRQRELLAIMSGKNDPKSTSSWTFLEESKLMLKGGKIGSGVYWKIDSNKFSMSDIPQGTLKSYFKKQNKWQKHEYIILKNYDFDIDNAYYISIPLIKFGEIDGLVHVVYEEDSKSKFEDKANIKDMINGFAVECEGVFLAWDLQETNQARARALRKMIYELAYELDYFSERSPIFRELKFPEYYKKHYQYFKDRLDQHDKVLQVTYEQVQRQSVITILLDSYAHNISAHALTSLTWIFKQRFEIKLKKMQLKNALLATRKILEDFRERAEQTVRTAYKSPKYSGPYASLINFPESLTLELYPFFKFLLEKGGFWSGLTRDHSGGGQVTNLYSTLWYEFVVNALYLGTIAESEDIRRIHVDITVYEPVRNVKSGSSKGFLEEKKVRIKGRLATIDLEKEVKHHYDAEKRDWYILLQDGKTRLTYSKHHGLENLSRFVQPGDVYEVLKEVLREISVFFPGGIVGKQAFYTIIENEIRNIKHYHGKDLREAKKEGLVLNISIQPASLLDNESVELYKMGVWLGVPSILSQSNRKEGSPLLVKRRFDILWDDVIEERSLKPRLGGTNQDKVCAAMLFNNNFSSVQKGSPRYLAFDAIPMPPRDKDFYPWVIPAVSFTEDNKDNSGGGQIMEFSIAPPGEYYQKEGYEEKFEAFQKSVEESYAQFKKIYGNTSNKGYVKKYFYLWKGEDIRQEQDEKELEWDNLGRFKFVYVAPENKTLWSKSRENGVVRIIRSLPNVTEGRLLTAVYIEWLMKWLDEPIYALQLQDEDKGSFIGGFLLNKKENSIYYVSDDIDANFDSISIFRPYTSYYQNLLNEAVKGHTSTRNLQCAHSVDKQNEDFLRYRSHGVINRYFTNPDRALKPKEITLKGVPATKLLELFEILATKICIFDNRVEHRITGRHDFYRDKLKIQFFSEIKPDNRGGLKGRKWDTEYKSAIKNTNFLVIHLSYLESILEAKYRNHKDFKDGNVGLFIEKELVELVGKDDGTLRDNFILVITTGRGRQNWMKFLEKEPYAKYRHNVIFRPIESILSAVEDSIMMKDDFEMKYRLTKTLFGS